MYVASRNTRARGFEYTKNRVLPVSHNVRRYLVFSIKKLLPLHFTAPALDQYEHAATTQHYRSIALLKADSIRTHDRSRRAAVDLRLRPRCHWDRHLIFHRTLKCFLSHYELIDFILYLVLVINILTSNKV
jgi:hypothetical protein